MDRSTFRMSEFVIIKKQERFGTESIWISVFRQRVRKYGCNMGVSEHAQNKYRSCIDPSK